MVALVLMTAPTMAQFAQAYIFRPVPLPQGPQPWTTYMPHPSTVIPAPPPPPQVFMMHPVRLLGGRSRCSSRAFAAA